MSKSKRKNLQAAETIYRSAPSSAVAQRAAYNATKSGNGNWAQGRELVTDVNEGKLDLAKLKREELPENMQKMSWDEIEKVIMKTSACRARLKTEIRRINEKRNSHIEAERKKAGTSAKDSLDHQLWDTVRTQAAKKGIKYGNKPQY